MLGVVIDRDEQKRQNDAAAVRKLRLYGLTQNFVAPSMVPARSVKPETAPPPRQRAKRGAPPPLAYSDVPPIEARAIRGLVEAGCNRVALTAIRHLLAGGVPGGLVCLTGPHASGKSTILSAVKRAMGNSMVIVDDAHRSEVAHLMIRERVARPSGWALVAVSDDGPFEKNARLAEACGGALCARLEWPDEDALSLIMAQKIGEIRARSPDFAMSADTMAAILGTVGINAALMASAINGLLARFWCGEMPTPAMVRDVMEPLRTAGRVTVRVKLDDIFRAVCERYVVSRCELLSQRRTADVVRPRQIAMYLAKNLTLHSLPEIGRQMAGRDHTTILHGVRRIGEMVQEDKAFATQVFALGEVITARAQERGQR